MPLGKVILMTVAVLCLSIFLISGTMNVAMIIGITLVLAGFEARNPILLKNLFLLYTFVLFGVAGQYFYPGETGLLWDMVVFLLAFLFGYSLLARNRRPAPTAVDAPIAFLKVATIERVMIFYCVTSLCILAYEVYTFGPGSYFSGAPLVLAFESYGREGFGLGLLTIAKQFMAVLNVSLLVLYVSVCSLAGRKIRYPIVVFMTVVLPVLLLQRSNLALGCLFLFVIVVWDKRPVFSVGVYARIVVVLLFVAAVGVGIGLLRDNALKSDSEGVSIALPGITRVLSGEFTPIVAYKEIKTNIDYLGYQYGNTILPTMLYKLVPRSWMPDKPTSSGGFFMEKLYPADAAAGYFISTSIFGDMYLNFGFLGVVVFCFLLGAFSARMDSIFIEHDIGGLPTFLIVYYYYYVLLRGDLQGSLSLVILTAAIYLFLRWPLGLLSGTAPKPGSRILPPLTDSHSGTSLRLTSYD